MIYEDAKPLLYLSAIILILGFGILLVVGVASANVFVYGSMPNYSAVVLKNGSYIHQGENITQGNFYEFSGIYGFTGLLAHWRNIDNAGYTYPDNIIDLNNYSRSNGVSFTIFAKVDPAVFPPGEYYQYEGVTCTQGGTCTSSFGHGNSYVFAVVAAPTPDVTKTIAATTGGDGNPADPHNTTLGYSKKIIVFDNTGNQSTIEVTDTIVAEQTVSQIQPIDSSIPVVTITVKQTPVNTSAIEQATTEDTSGEVPIDVTPRSPVLSWIPVIAIILGVLLFRTS